MKVAFSLTVWLTAAAALADEAMSVDALKAAVTEWQDRVAFTSTFELRVGLARSLDDALRGEFDDRLAEAHPRTAFRVTGMFNKLGQAIRYSVAYGKPPIQLHGFVKADSQLKAWTRVSSDEVTNGELEVVYTPLQGILGDSAVITARGASRVGKLPPGTYSSGQINPLAPLGMDDAHPLSLLPVRLPPQSSNNMQAKLRRLPDNRWEVVLQSSSSGLNQERRVTLRLDANLPVVEKIVQRLEFEDGRSQECNAVLSDFQQCDGGSVARQVLCATASRRADGSPLLVGLRVWKSGDLGVKRPTNEDFVITVPGTTRIIGLAQRPPKGTPRRIDLESLSVDDLTPGR